MLHRVRPRSSARFQPNRALEVTPEFLEAMIGWLRSGGYRFVSVDEARARLVNRDFRTRFVSVTLDDGYRDNMTWAKPIFARHGVPYTIYVPTSFADGDGDLWWLALESIVANNDRIELDDRVIASATIANKARAFASLKTMTVNQPTPAERRAFVRRLAERYRYDNRAAVRDACMSWDELRQVVADPLATIGAHTVSHPVLSELSESEVREELVQSRRLLERQLEREIRHLAYPFGSRNSVGEREFRIAAEVGYATAVTTRLAVVNPADKSRLKALPRINIDGRYQRKCYFDVLLSGVAPALWSARPGFLAGRRRRELAPA